MKLTAVTSLLLALFVAEFAHGTEGNILFAGERKLNNLVSELLEVASIAKSGSSFTFARSRSGWILVSASFKGRGTARIVLDKAPGADAVIVHDVDEARLDEAVRFAATGDHEVRVECEGGISVDKLAVKANPKS